MKKIYALFATAMLSLSLFAAPATVPTEGALTSAGYDLSNVVLCFYFDVAPCEGLPVVLAGDYNGWSTKESDLAVFEELDGFPGWYAVQIPFVLNGENGPYAKPVQVVAGTYEKEEFWDYQAGDPDAWKSLGGNAFKKESENGNETKAMYPTAGAYIIELEYWKAHKSPCVETQKYNYTIYLLDPYCEGSDFVPAIVGDLNKWKGTPMNETVYDGEFAYVLQFPDEADHKIKFREASTSDWSNQLQENVNGGWKDFDDYFLPAVTIGFDTTIVFDYSDTEKYRYKQCGAIFYDITLNAKLPANAPEIVELMGDFKGGVWDGTGVIMTKKDDGTYTAQIKGDPDNQFKFRSGVGSNDEKWANQIWKFDDQTEAWKECGNFVFGNEEMEVDDDELTAICEVDLSDYDAFRWATDVPSGTGIENVVLTEKARKVVVDGQLYIIRDNKLFNIHGAQLR